MTRICLKLASIWCDPQLCSSELAFHFWKLRVKMARICLKLASTSREPHITFKSFISSLGVIFLITYRGGGTFDTYPPGYHHSQSITMLAPHTVVCGSKARIILAFWINMVRGQIYGTAFLSLLAISRSFSSRRYIVSPNKDTLWKSSLTSKWCILFN